MPSELFDSVADNFLQNAIEKRQAAPPVQIRLRLVVEDGIQLIVCDSGEPLSESLVRTLFTAPVPSRHGFGVGLYQAARQATALGYCLDLASNAPGNICFRLAHVEERVLKAVAPPTPAQ